METCGGLLLSQCSHQRFDVACRVGLDGLAQIDHVHVGVVPPDATYALSRHWMKSKPERGKRGVSVARSPTILR